MKIDKKKDNNQYRINEQIRAKEVRIVSDDGSMVVPTRQALEMARQREEDLVMMSPNAEPPVCRIIDYSKFLYQQIHLTYYIKCLCYLVKFLEPVLL